MHEIRFSDGDLPRTLLGGSQRSPDPTIGWKEISLPIRLWGLGESLRSGIYPSSFSTPRRLRASSCAPANWANVFILQRGERKAMDAPIIIHHYHHHRPSQVSK